MVDGELTERCGRSNFLCAKNFLFVGDEDSGEHRAGLYSLVATCEANGADPIAYLADVLLRIDTHPASRIDDLLPHKWSPLPTPVQQ